MPLECDFTFTSLLREAAMISTRFRYLLKQNTDVIQAYNDKDSKAELQFLLCVFKIPIGSIYLKKIHTTSQQ
jgi:hypothetical protein